jgi:hypothetical protein
MHAGRLPALPVEGTAALLQTVGGFEITWARPAPAEGPVPPARVPVAAASPAVSRRAAIESADPLVVQHALAEAPLSEDLVEPAIARLAWDDVAPAARQALARVAGRETPRLVAHLLDPAEDFAIRRRLVAVLAECPTGEAFEGLLRALDDRRFEVRYRAGRALAHLRDVNSRLGADAERVLAVVLREVTVERPVWEGRQLIDEADEPWAPGDVELLRARASRSMDHVFTLLALVLPREPLFLAYRGLQTDDPQIHGTALEYLESVLPERARKGLWPFLEPTKSARKESLRAPQEALHNLLASRESIQLALDRRPPA